MRDSCIRGDGNVNPKNSARVVLLQQLIRDYKLIRTDTGHNTYHHFVGDGLYDSDIDILLHTSTENVCEEVHEIICKNDDPTILSHHDIILSNFSIPTQAIIQTRNPHNIAPRVDHTRTRISWSEQGQQEYCELVAPHLRDLREQWLDPSSQVSMSVLLSLTNDILTTCATMTNEYEVVGTNRVAKSKRIPKAIKLATNKMIKAHRVFKKCNIAKEAPKAREAFVCSRKKYRQAVRQHRLKDSLQRYHKMDNIFTKPSAAYAYLRACKNTKPKKIEQLSVGTEQYVGDEVCDGFYVSMNAIKQCSIDELREDTNLASQFVNYDSIMQLCKNKPPIPPISLEKSTKILRSLRKNVSDYYSITSLHYLHAGKEGIKHYHSIINGLIVDVNNSKIEEINVAHGNILYKGHKKEKTSSRSYRTISSCPFLAKSIDYYLRDLITMQCRNVFGFFLLHFFPFK